MRWRGLPRRCWPETRGCEDRGSRTCCDSWFFTGVVFVAFFTAQLTTSLTLEQIRGVINGPDYLPGKAVATLSGSTSADYLREIGLKRRVRTSRRSLLGLARRKVDAVVLPSPVLRYTRRIKGGAK